MVVVTKLSTVVGDVDVPPGKDDVPPVSELLGDGDSPAGAGVLGVGDVPIAAGVLGVGEEPDGTMAHLMPAPLAV